MAFGFIQSISSTGVASLAFSSNVTAGSLIVVHLAGVDSVTSTVTDNLGNSYSRVLNLGTSYAYSMWIAFGAAAGATTISASGMGGSANSNIAICEYSLVSTYNWNAMMTNNINLGGSDVPIPLFTTPTQTLVIMGLYDFASFHSWSATNLTVRETTHEPDSATLGCADGIFTDITTATSAMMSGATSSFVAGCTLALYATPSGGGGGIMVGSGMTGGMRT